MTPEDCESLMDRLTVLSEYYEKPKSEAQVEIYVLALKDLPIHAVLAAMNAHVNASPFFPKVSDIRALVEGESSEHADRAWGLLLREVRAVGYTGTPELTEALRATVNAIWGSWVNLCQTLPAEGPELLGWAKQFKATYRTMANRTLREFITGGVRGLLEP